MAQHTPTKAQKLSNCRVYLNAGNQFEEEGKLDRAIEQYQEALKLNPNLHPALNRLAEIYTEQQEFNLTLNCRQKLVQLQPDSATVQANLAKAMIDGGQIDEAITTYRKAIALPNPPARIYRELGKALEKSGESEEALAAYQKAINLQPENPRFHLLQSELYFKQKKIEQAIEKAEVALQLNAEFLPALNQLVAIYQKNNELDKATYYCQQLVKLQPENPIFCRQLMDLYAKVISKKDDLEDAISTYQNVLNETPSTWSAIPHESLGQSLLQLGIRKGQIERVIAFLQEAIAAQPNDPWYHYYLGISFTKEHSFDEAMSCFQKAVQIQPNFWQALAEAGVLLKVKGDRKQGFQYFIQALKNNPSLPLEYYRSSCSPSSDREWELLKSLIKKNENKSKNINIIYYAIGQKLSQQDSLREASDLYQKSIYYKLKKSKPEYISQYWKNGTLQEPNFLLIGVSKCGSTALYNYISQHTKTLPAIVKEPGYLRSLLPKLEIIGKQNNRLFLESERDFYLAHFPPRSETNQFITGEASAATIFLFGAEKIVYNWFPKIKLIVILRDPIKRAISFYDQLLKTGHQKFSLKTVFTKELEEVEDFDRMLEKLKNIKFNDHIATGLYFYHLERWMKLFPREQFLILSNEDLARDPASVMKQTFDFLGLPECHNINYTPRNVGHYPKDIDPNLLSRLQEFYQPHNQKLEEFLGRKFNWD